MASNPEYIPFSRQIAVNPSPRARRLLWQLYSLGTIYLDQPDHHKPFEKPGVHLFWVVSGSGALNTQGHTYNLKPGNRVWFIDMLSSRTYSPVPGKRLTIRGVRFGGPGLENWHEELGGSRKAEFSLEDPVPIQYAYRELWQLIKARPSAWEWQTHMIIQRILGLLLASRNLLGSDQIELPAPVVRVLNAIASNPFYDWKAKDLAPLAGVSHSTLRTLFLRTQHTSLHHFIQRERLDQAKVLLSDLRLSVKQIAEQLHFSSQFYFSHFFKKWGGISPTDFRSQLQERR